MLGRIGRVLGGLALWGFGSCAHAPAASSAGLSSVDLRDADDTGASLRRYQGKILVLDLCAAWSDPCLLNARALDEACQIACGDDVAMVSLLLDEPGQPALASYREVLEVHQDVWLPGPRSQAGNSVLGPLQGIPRLVVWDREGRIVEDVAGGVTTRAALLRRVERLRGRSFAR